MRRRLRADAGIRLVPVPPAAAVDEDDHRCALRVFRRIHVERLRLRLHAVHRGVANIQFTDEFRRGRRRSGRLRGYLWSPLRHACLCLLASDHAVLVLVELLEQPRNLVARQLPVTVAVELLEPLREAAACRPLRLLRRESQTGENSREANDCPFHFGGSKMDTVCVLRFRSRNRSALTLANLTLLPFNNATVRSARSCLPRPK